MKQMQFNENFTNIVEENPSFWTEVPSFISSFAEEKKKQRVIMDGEYFYCPICLQHLENGFCAHCQQQYDMDATDMIYWVPEEERTEYTFLYYAFCVCDEDVYLYVFREVARYERFYGVIPHCFSDMQIDAVYKVVKDGVQNIKTGQKHLYSDMISDENEDGLERHEWFSYLYVDSLDALQDTKLYRYTFLWDAKKFLGEKSVTVSMLTAIPFLYPQVEYLIKLKLYDMAFFAPDRFAPIGGFEQIFGVPKKCLPLMQKLNLSFSELELLKCYPTEDEELFSFFCRYLTDGIAIAKRVSLGRVWNYFQKNEMKEEDIAMYANYLDLCEKYGYDMKDHTVLFPSYLETIYLKLYEEDMLLQNPQMNDKIASMAKLLELNRYEDADYIIYAPSSIRELIDESMQQHNCVRGYVKSIAEGTSQIYFMRKKEQPDVSFVTIEIVHATVFQAYYKYNEPVGDDIMQVLKKWEAQLVPMVQTS